MLVHSAKQVAGETIQAQANANQACHQLANKLPYILTSGVNLNPLLLLHSMPIVISRCHHRVVFPSSLCAQNT